MNGKEQDIPRFMVAGTNSGCGKTTVTCAVLQAFANRGLNVGAFKCGPDYIDPMFHSSITGTKSTNLDGFFFDGNTMNYLLAQGGAGRDISVIEGVMGYYDGLSLTRTEASSYETALATKTPVVLAVNAKGASLSVLAVIQGFLEFRPHSQIQGAILNQCSPMSYPALSKAILESFQGRIQPLGYLPRLENCALESRRLGLVTARETADLKEKLQRLAEQAEKTIDLDGLQKLGESAAAVSCEPVNLPRFEPVRIALARDKAFCFYYEDNLRMLREMGAELAEFSPLSDVKLPENIHGLYLGGGYPELYAKELSENRSMLESVRRAIQKGLPCIAECGGFMYLNRSIAGYPMAGVLPGECFDTGKLTRFGYVTLTAKKDSLLCKAGEEIRGHEFHYWDSTALGGDFSAVKPSGKSWDCVIATDRLYAGFPHFHFYANPSFAERFYQACLKEKKANV